MPKPTKGPRIGGTPTHQRIILGNLASQLFEHGRIKTTETRAKRVQPLAEHLITKAKRGDLHARRIVMKTITDTTVVHILFTEIAPTMAKRDGGYTRITKVGPRQGDNAPMAIIEIVTEELEPKAKAKKAESKRPAKKAEKVKDTVEKVEESTTEELAEATEGEAVVEEATAEATEVVEDVADAADTAEAVEGAEKN